MVSRITAVAVKDIICFLSSDEEASAVGIFFFMARY